MKSKEVNIKKILSITVLALFLFASMSFVLSASADDTKSGLDVSLENAFEDGPIKDWFTNWEDGYLSANIAKYLFWALVSMIVFTIGKTIPGLKQMFENDKTDFPILGIAFSVIVGFLSMAYITPAEVYAMMTGYSALGYVLGGFLPLIILGFFTMSIATTKSKNSHTRLTRRLLASVMWLGYALFAVIKAMGAPPEAKVLSWIIAMASVTMLISIKPLMRKISKNLNKEKVKTLANKISFQKAKRDLEADDIASQ